jgi:Zn-dependent peptidase ImmA (M78 family)/transcriptional regulator with XRE-family HTH domain
MSRLDDIESRELGERLRSARSQAGLTQEQAASSLGLARTTLVAIEQGQRRARADELLEFSRLYGASVGHLLRPSAPRTDLVAQFRRLMSSRSDRGAGEEARAEAVRLLNRLAGASVELERLLGVPAPVLGLPELPIVAGDVVQQAEDAALSVRHRLGIGLAPIEDVVSLLELELGVRVFIAPLSSHISGLAAYDPVVGACILLNRKHPRERRAMSAAHETGHIVSTRRTPDVNEEGEQPDTREERFAVAFGIAFLMPAAAVRHRFREICAGEGRFSARHLVLLARAFHVSPEAMCRRLEGLGLLPPHTWETLRHRGFSGETVRQVIGDAVSEEGAVAPPRLSLLAAEAFFRGLLSEGQLCDMLQMDHVEVRDLLDALDAEGADAADLVAS